MLVPATSLTGSPDTARQRSAVFGAVDRAGRRAVPHPDRGPADLARLAPQDAIASVVHTARTITEVAIQSPAPGHLPT